MCAASLVYAVRMSESYDIRCRVGARQIVAPIGAGEARIPALVRLRDEHLILFFDERPAPASGTGADFNGLTMASDLPNPNRIRWMERDGRCGWSDPRELPTGAPPSRRTPAWGSTAADSCTWRSPRARGRRLHGLARGRERLRARWAWGSGPAELTYADMTDAHYEVTGADTLFSTSGATATVDGEVAMPYVVRVGEQTYVQVVDARAGAPGQRPSMMAMRGS